jgi:hypothetical protein
LVRRALIPVSPKVGKTGLIERAWDRPLRVSYERRES